MFRVLLLNFVIIYISAGPISRDEVHGQRMETDHDHDERSVEKQTLSESGMQLISSKQSSSIILTNEEMQKYKSNKKTEILGVHIEPPLVAVNKQILEESKLPRNPIPIEELVSIVEPKLVEKVAVVEEPRTPEELVQQIHVPVEKLSLMEESEVRKELVEKIEPIETEEIVLVRKPAKKEEEISIKKTISVEETLPNKELTENEDSVYLKEAIKSHALRGEAITVKDPMTNTNSETVESQIKETFVEVKVPAKMSPAEGKDPVVKPKHQIPLIDKTSEKQPEPSKKTIPVDDSVLEEESHISMKDHMPLNGQITEEHNFEKIINEKQKINVGYLIGENNYKENTDQISTANLPQLPKGIQQTQKNANNALPENRVSVETVRDDVNIGKTDIEISVIKATQVKLIPSYDDSVHAITFSDSQTIGNDAKQSAILSKRVENIGRKEQADENKKELSEKIEQESAMKEESSSPDKQIINENNKKSPSKQYVTNIEEQKVTVSEIKPLIDLSDKKDSQGSKEQQNIVADMQDNLEGNKKHNIVYDNAVELQKTGSLDQIAKVVDVPNMQEQIITVISSLPENHKPKSPTESKTVEILKEASFREEEGVIRQKEKNSMQEFPVQLVKETSTETSNTQQGEIPKKIIKVSVDNSIPHELKKKKVDHVVKINEVSHTDAEIEKGAVREENKLSKEQTDSINSPNNDEVESKANEGKQFVNKRKGSSEPYTSADVFKTSSTIHAPPDKLESHEVETSVQDKEVLSESINIPPFPQTPDDMQKLSETVKQQDIEKIKEIPVKLTKEEKIIGLSSEETTGGIEIKGIVIQVKSNFEDTIHESGQVTDDKLDSQTVSKNSFKTLIVDELKNNMTETEKTYSNQAAESHEIDKFVKVKTVVKDIVRENTEINERVPDDKQEGKKVEEAQLAPIVTKVQENTPKKNEEIAVQTDTKIQSENAAPIKLNVGEDVEKIQKSENRPLIDMINDAERLKVSASLTDDTDPIRRESDEISEKPVAVANDVTFIEVAAIDADTKREEIASHEERIAEHKVMFIENRKPEAVAQINDETLLDKRNDESLKASDTVIITKIIPNKINIESLTFSKSDPVVLNQQKEIIVEQEPLIEAQLQDVESVVIDIQNKEESEPQTGINDGVSYMNKVNEHGIINDDKAAAIQHDARLKTSVNMNHEIQYENPSIQVLDEQEIVQSKVNVLDEQLLEKKNIRINDHVHENEKIVPKPVKEIIETEENMEIGEILPDSSYRNQNQANIKSENVMLKSSIKEIKQGADIIQEYIKHERNVYPRRRPIRITKHYRPVQPLHHFIPRPQKVQQFYRKPFYKTTQQRGLTPLTRRTFQQVYDQNRKFLRNRRE